MTANELRSKYIEFFKSKNHVEISGQSLIPENDPSVLFTTAGMHPLVPYLLGEKHPAGTLLTDDQKCIRTGDIDEVGDPSHLTCFEMLGNWSLGDYFKKESIGFSYVVFETFLLSSDQCSAPCIRGDIHEDHEQSHVPHGFIQAGRFSARGEGRVAEDENHQRGTEVAGIGKGGDR